MTFLSQDELKKRRAKMFDSCIENCGDVSVRSLIIILSSMASEVAYEATSEITAQHLLDCGIRFGKLIRSENNAR
jgi:hypothetical protein